jgi:hypothetical protein
MVSRMSASLENTPTEDAASSSPVACTHCHQAFRGHFFQANGTPFCGTCMEALRTSLEGPGSSAGRFLRAILIGCGAAAVSAIGYGLFMGLTHIEFALVTIAIGWFIGKAVRNGSGNRGGWRYGLLAVVLTYCAIAFSHFGVAVAAEIKDGKKDATATASVVKGASTSHVPAATEGKPSEDPASAEAESGAPKAVRKSPLLAIPLLIATAFAMPILVATQSILSALITGFGLWEAWKINRRMPEPEITGPYAVPA